MKHKHFVVLISVLIITSLTSFSSANKTIKIATWNIRDLSTSSRSDFELLQIAYILKNFDLIAIQEVNDEDSLDMIIAWLETIGHSYAKLFSPVSGTGSEAEHYAFLFREDVIEPLDSGHLAKGTFARPPYIASFRAGDFDFTIISVHICSGCGSLGEAGRELEIARLGIIYNNLMSQSEKDILVVGDFNLNPNNNSFINLKSVENTLPVYPCSTLSECKQNATTTRDSNLIDNIWYSETQVQEYTGEHDIFKFDEVLYEDPKGDSDDYRERYSRLAVSDHRPVWADFRIDMSDDD
ncbi:MAG: endonuclease/exonuclease/phosphatase family protein [Deltaproteobacteria bacterium]